mgnify:CR=1 FL=1
MEFASEGPKAIPLWVNGHAFLTVAARFHDVVNPLTGEVLHRVPLCGWEEAAEAVAAARAAQPAWAAWLPAQRQAALEALAAALDRYSGHFAKLLRAETGLADEQVRAEVASALAALRGEDVGDAGVVAIVADATRPLAGFAETVAPALRAGATAIVKAMRACGQPIVAAIDGVCRAAIDRLVFVGEATLGAQVGAIAAAAGRPFAMREA